MKAAFTLLLAGVAVAAPRYEGRIGLAPLHSIADDVKTTGGYIAVFHDDVEDSEDDFRIAGLSGIETFFSGHALKGFAGKFDAASLALIRADPRVAYVEHDTIMHALPIETSDALEARDTQGGAPYGLAISSQEGYLSPSQQNTYYYESNPGAGVYVYVVDTGVNTGHSQFGGRATMAANYVSGAPNTDDNGHGTHCAGTIGGSTYGIAKSVNIRGVKVLNAQGSGSTSAIVSGINFAVSNCPGKCVISMSLGGSYQSALNSAVRNAVNAGVTTVVAAGNEGQNACNVSPASESSAITVGAIDTNYQAASFSNYGSCVDIWGPGVNILSAWIGSSTATNTISGTSMATPHIAGLAAYFLSFGASGPSGALQYLQYYGQTGLLPNSEGSPNLVGNNGYFA